MPIPAPRRAFFTSLYHAAVGTVLGACGFRSCKTLAAEPARITARLVVPPPMTLERAIEILNEAKYRDCSWMQSNFAEWVIAVRYPITAENGLVCRYEDPFTIIALAEKIGREGRNVNVTPAQTTDLPRHLVPSDHVDFIWIHGEPVTRRVS